MTESQGLNDGRLAVPKHWTNIKHSVEPKLAREVARLDTYLHVDLAHAVMLVENGILARPDGQRLVGALRALRADPASLGGVDPQLGSLVAQIERKLTEQIGADSAKRLHTARSRNDLHEAINRILFRDALLEIVEGALSALAAMLATAERHAGDWMPGYTHLQRAMPTTLGHYWLRHCYVLGRDLDRLTECYARVDLSALGGAALVGTTWPIDRRRVAELLGHPGIVVHSTDAGIFARDMPAEIAATLSILVNDLARPLGDIYVWSSSEFGFAEVRDALADTSSIMPQKKNPEAIERVRGIAGMATGWLVGVLAMQRSAFSTDMDLAYGPDPTADYLADTRAVLDLSAAVIEGTSYRLEAMDAAARDQELMATNLADWLVRERSLPFRTAHQLVGRVVRLARAASDGATRVTTELLDVAADELGLARPSLAPEELAIAVELDSFAGAVVSEGGVGRDSIAEMLVEVAAIVERGRVWLDAARERRAAGDRRLEDAAAAILRGEEG